MVDKQFYADDFFRDERGVVVTGQNLEHNDWLKEHHTFKKVENPYAELQGVTVRCNYSQIFYPNSSMILCNNIVEADEDLFDNVCHGSLTAYYDEEGDECDEEKAYDSREREIFQWYLIDEQTAERLIQSTDEIIFYSNELDLYVLGVTHFGTAWDYVDTDFVY